MPARLRRGRATRSSSRRRCDGQPETTWASTRWRSASRACRSGLEASLLQRVFRVEVLKGPCGGRRKVTAFIPSGELARKILEKLGVDAT